MKILMLTPRFPYPPNRGDTVRSWSQLEYLAARHNVWLACVDERAPRPEHLDRVQSICRDVAVATSPKLRSLARGGLSLVAGHSLTEGYYHSTTLGGTVRAWASAVHFDAVLTYSSAMAPLAELVDARRVLDLNDVDSHKWQTYASRGRAPMKWLYACEARRTRALERHIVQTNDVTLVVNERERRKLLDLMTPRASDVIRTAVDLEPPSDSQADATQPPAVGMVGSMFYPPNVRAAEWFGRNVWPRLHAMVPEAQWWIIGNRPTRQVRRWGRRPNVTVTGFVPSIEPYFDAMRVFVNAVHGNLGVQTKLLMAMAAGKPAVVTPDSAAGIDYEGEPPFLVAESPVEFADAVERLLYDDALARSLGTRAREVIRDYYQPADQWHRIEQWLMGTPPNGAPAVKSETTEVCV